MSSSESENSDQISQDGSTISDEESDSSGPSEEYKSCDEQKTSATRSRRQRIESSSDSVVSVELPASESEDEEPVVRRGISHLVDPDTESEPDEEEKLRKAANETGSDGEDDRIEDQAYSKTTRRSIFGYELKQESFVGDSEDESDGEVIDCTKEANEEDVVSSSDVEDEHIAANIKKETSVTSKYGLSEDVVSSSDFEDDQIAVKKETSFKKEKSASMVTPAALEEDKENIKLEPPQLSSTLNDSFETSITSKMSSTTATRDGSLLDEAASSNSIKVSRSQYDQAIAEKVKIMGELTALTTCLRIGKDLPDKGEKIKRQYESLKIALEKQEKLLSTLEIDESLNLKNVIARNFLSEHADNSNPIASNEKPPVDYMKIDDVVAQVTTAKALQKFTQGKALTVDKLENMAAELSERPAETELIDPPKYLKGVQLKEHQLHGVKFMQWRETKKPRGGILADDMGLGKTLTTLCLVLKSIQQREDEGVDSESDSEDERDNEGWIARGRKDLRDGGTLVVCPASLLHQWGHEIDTRIKRGALKYHAFHGAKRETSARHLARHDVVMTTYGLVASEMQSQGLLYQIKWNRIVLDEGHVIRNHRSKQSEAVCKLNGKYRWVLTGTPIHNKEFDLYACIKFLRCAPFDDVVYWRRFVEIKNASSPRVQTLLNTIMIRRTKEQLMASGHIDDLPNKSYQQINVVLNVPERKIYNRFLAYSKSIFAAFMDQQLAKENNFMEGLRYDHKYLDRAYQKLAQQHGIDHAVQTSEILTLILRLRQICCHTGLIKTALEHLPEVENLDGNDGELNESDGGILSRFEALNIADGEGDVSIGQVQNLNVKSTKIEAMFEVLNHILQETNDKIIIVSQWTSYLEIIGDMLEEDGITYCELTGRVAVKDRNNIVMKLNEPNSGIRIMLLSLTAGGVGLNLTGANHLLLMDCHWNPQLELQAQDRIYRFGQTKDIIIYKFFCTDTFEERVQELQQQKLAIAAASLTGAKNQSLSKLTMNDLKTLFGM